MVSPSPARRVIILNVKRKEQSFILNCLAPGTLLLLLAVIASAQSGSTSLSSSQPSGSLSEIVNKRWAFLLVKRVAVVDASNERNSIIEEALKSDLRPNRRYRAAYNTIADKLNKFMKKYGNMSAVGEINGADYIIFFNLLEYRWPLGTPYPYGELYVIVRPEPGTQGKPRVVWKSKKVMWAADAADDLIDELKSIWWNKAGR